MTTRYAALWRGINVGKAKRLAMADLRALLEGFGYADVKTLLNSGNAVFEAGDQSPAAIARRIRTAVAAELAVDAGVIVVPAAQFAKAVAANPHRKIARDPARHLVAFTADPEALARLAPFAGTDWAPDRFTLGEHAAYLWCADGILQSRCAVKLLKDLGDTGTTRNWATVEKLHALLQA